MKCDSLRSRAMDALVWRPNFKAPPRNLRQRFGFYARQNPYREASL